MAQLKQVENAESRICTSDATTIATTLRSSQANEQTNGRRVKTNGVKVQDLQEPCHGETNDSPEHGVQASEYLTKRQVEIQDQQLDTNVDKFEDIHSQLDDLLHRVITLQEQLQFVTRTSLQAKKNFEWSETRMSELEKKLQPKTNVTRRGRTVTKRGNRNYGPPSSSFHTMLAQDHTDNQDQDNFQRQELEMRNCQSTNSSRMNSGQDDYNQGTKHSRPKRLMIWEKNLFQEQGWCTFCRSTSHIYQDCMHPNKRRNSSKRIGVKNKRARVKNNKTNCVGTPSGQNHEDNGEAF
jgi:predicted metal-binding protein